VAAALAFVTWGGFVFGGGAAAQLGGEGEPGAPIEVLQGVTVTPAAGWSFYQSTQDPPGSFLQGNGGFLFVTASQGGTDPPEAMLDAYLASLGATTQAASFTRGPTESFTITAGPGADATYSGIFDGSPLEGVAYSVLTPSGLGITLDGYAPEGRYFPGLVEQVADMVGSLQAA
jgi:hypothetical protein